MENIDFTQLPLTELKALGCIRWGRAPIANLWLIPGPLLHRALPGQTLYGIDGKPYVVGFDIIDGTLLFGFLAYGVKVDSDVQPGGPELSPEKLAQMAEDAMGRGKLKRAERKMSEDRGMFFPN